MSERETLRPDQGDCEGVDSQPERSDSVTFWQWIRYTARLWGFLAFILLILGVFRAVILPFILAVLVAFVLAPIVRRISEMTVKGFRLPRFVAVIIVYLSLAGFGGLFVTSFVPRVSRDLKRVVVEAPGLWKQVKEDWAPQVASWLKANFGADPLAPSLPPKREQTKPPADPVSQIRMVPQPDGSFALDLNDLQAEFVPSPNGGWFVRTPKPDDTEQAPRPIGESVQAYVDDLVESSEQGTQHIFVAAQSLLTGIFAAFTTLLLVFMISLFLLIDTDRILGWLRNLVPKIYHRDFDEVVRRIDKALSGAIRGQLVICVVNGVLTGVGLVLIGVKYAFLLGLTAGILSLIPIFGSILSTIPIVVVALVSTSSGVAVAKALLAVGWIGGIHLLEANLLNPKIIGTAARIHPVIVIFAVVAGQRSYGPMGALLAVPIVSAIQAMFIYLRARADDTV